MSWFSDLWNYFFKKEEAYTGVDALIKLLFDQACMIYGVDDFEKPSVPRAVLDVQVPVAIYDVTCNVIKLQSEGNANSKVLSHEVAHSVIIQYLNKNKRLTVTMHEILAGYAEYKLKDLVI